MSDDLRVRSLPEVSEASIKFEPLLPTGTELVVLGGPVQASGFTWYRVAPASFRLADSVVDGWDAASFMQTLKGYIENPLRLLSA